MVAGVKGRVGRNWIQVVTHPGGCRQQKQGLLNGSTDWWVRVEPPIYHKLFTPCVQCAVYTVCEVFSMCTCGCLERAEEEVLKGKPIRGERNPTCIKMSFAAKLCNRWTRSSAVRTSDFIEKVCHWICLVLFTLRGFCSLYGYYVKIGVSIFSWFLRFFKLESC